MEKTLDQIYARLEYRENWNALLLLKLMRHRAQSSHPSAEIEQGNLQMLAWAYEAGRDSMENVENLKIEGKIEQNILQSASDQRVEGENVIYYQFR